MTNVESRMPKDEGSPNDKISNHRRIRAVLWRFGDGGEPTKSARGLAQSKTLPRNPQVYGPNACGKANQGFPRTWERRHPCRRVASVRLAGEDAGAPGDGWVQGPNAGAKEEGGAP